MGTSHSISMSIQARLFSCPFWIFDLLSLKNSKSIIIYRTFDLLPERHLIYIVHPFSKSAHHDNESGNRQCEEARRPIAPRHATRPMPSRSTSTPVVQTPTAGGNNPASATTAGGAECQICYTESPMREMFQCRSFKSRGFCKRFMHIQQQQELRAAGIEGLHECPFCDFKAITPPIEKESQFQCLKPSCKKVSCRKCNRESHKPRTCEEVDKDRHLGANHRIEEAMSDAVI